VSVADQIRRMNFEDSCFRGIHIVYSDGNTRSCHLDIDYYNWEDNAGKAADEPWQWRRLVLTIGHLAHIEMSAPDVVNRAQDIDSVELGYGLGRFREEWRRFRKAFPRGAYPLFRNDEETLSVRFATQNWGDETAGYVWVVGSQVSLRWIEDDLLVGQTHFPLSEE